MHKRQTPAELTVDSKDITQVTANSVPLYFEKNDGIVLACAKFCTDMQNLVAYSVTFAHWCDLVQPASYKTGSYVTQMKAGFFHSYVSCRDKMWGKNTIIPSQRTVLGG